VAGWRDEDEDEDEELPTRWQTRHAKSVLDVQHISTAGWGAAASGEHCIIHDLCNGTEVYRVQSSGRIYCLLSSHRFLALCGADEAVHVFDLHTGTRHGVLRLNDTHTCCLNTSCILAGVFIDGMHVVTGGYDKKLTFWQIQKCTQICTTGNMDQLKS